MNTRRTTIRTALASALLIPAALAAQVRVHIALLEPEPTAEMARCGSNRSGYKQVWDVLNESAALDPEAARATLRSLGDSLAVVATERPTDVQLQYALAAVVGARAEVEGGLAQVEAAKEAHGRARAVIELAPDHPGAQHIIGRLHLEVLRMSRLKRFLATRVLGGSELAGASWEVARRLLVAGAVGDPCSLEHQYHLARLYAEVGDSDLALERLEALLGREPRSARDRAVASRAAVLRERLSAEAAEASH
jgi:tetratricopeptide (TPR) repeat protein